MATQLKSSKFKLVEIDYFDARRGYKRCSIPGVGCSDAPGFNAIADFWRDQTGRLVVRLSCRGYIYHLGASLVSGKNVPENIMEEFSQYVMHTLRNWLLEGVDDLPSSVNEPS